MSYFVVELASDHPRAQLPPGSPVGEFVTEGAARIFVSLANMLPRYRGMDLRVREETALPRPRWMDTR